MRKSEHFTCNLRGDETHCVSESIDDPHQGSSKVIADILKKAKNKIGSD